MRDRFLSWTIVAVAAAILLAGCGSSPLARFYTLTPLAPSEAKQPAGSGTSRTVINIAPVEIPDYLDRPQIVTRDGGNRLVFAEFDRWAGSLGENISAVLAEDLTQLLGPDRVFVNSGPALKKADYTVDMRVLRLDCLPAEHVTLNTQWTVFSGPNGNNAAMHVSNVTEKVADKRYDTMVAAINRAVEQVSREIAGQIRLQ